MRQAKDLVNSTLSDAINAAYLQYQATKDEKSFNFIYRALNNFCKGYITRTKDKELFLNTAEQFDDIFQDVMLKVFLTNVTIDLNRASVTTFFITAFSNKIKDMKKLKRNQNIRFDEDDNIPAELHHYLSSQQ